MDCVSSIEVRWLSAITMPIELAQALWILECFLPEDWPGVACDALEQGHDGPALRRLAGLAQPTHFDIRDLVPQALVEAGQQPITAKAAGIRYAHCVSREIVAGQIEPAAGAAKLARMHNRVMEIPGAARIFTGFYILNERYLLAKNGIHGSEREVAAEIVALARKTLPLAEPE
jgi:hypothetical protein